MKTMEEIEFNLEVLESDLPIVHRLVSPGWHLGSLQQPTDKHRPRPGGPDDVQLIVLHATAGMNTMPAVHTLAESAKKVSAHFVVAPAGYCVQLAPTSVATWHAGVSKWRQQGSVNRFSVGIEMVNPGWKRKGLDPDDWSHGWEKIGRRHYATYPMGQVQEVALLCASLCMEYNLDPRERIVGHCNVSPKRKLDPYASFPWEKFFDMTEQYVKGVGCVHA